MILATITELDKVDILAAMCKSSSSFYINRKDTLALPVHCLPGVIEQWAYFLPRSSDCNKSVKKADESFISPQQYSPGPKFKSNRVLCSMALANHHIRASDLLFSVFAKCKAELKVPQNDRHGIAVSHCGKTTGILKWSLKIVLTFELLSFIDFEKVLFPSSRSKLHDCC